MAALKCGLVAQALREFGSVTFRAYGTSMLPSIRPGDTVTVQRCRPAEVRPGDLVLFHRAQRLYLHRVVERQERQGSILLRTRGDRLRDCDPPIGEDEFLGIAVASGRPLSPVRSWRRRLLQAILRSSDTAAAFFARQR